MHVISAPNERIGFSNVRFCVNERLSNKHHATHEIISIPFETHEVVAFDFCIEIGTFQHIE